MTVTLFLVLLCGLVGLMIGSFLNVVIWRVPRGESVVNPPSACPKCEQPIRNRDNVPVLGWLVLKGKCRDCSAPISPRYPLVELGTGLLFAAMAWRFGFSEQLPAYLYLAAVGIALAMIDLDLKRLPDALTLPSWVVAAVTLGGAAFFGHYPDAPLRALIGAAALGGFYFAVWFLYPAGMGFGDVKLAPVLGAYLAWISYGALAVGAFLGFFYGAVISIGLVMFSDAGRKTKVAFGPFMILGALTGIFFGQDLADAYVSLTVG